jgi:hypothetical protein
MYKFLRVTAIGDVKRNEAGLEYRQVWFRPILQLESGVEVFSNQQDKSRTLFDAHDTFKADPLYAEMKAGNIKVGTLIEGSIQRFDTTPYQPAGYQKPVTSYTCVVFASENGLTHANRQLKANEACVVDSTGNLTASEQLKTLPAMQQHAEIEL